MENFEIIVKCACPCQAWVKVGDKLYSERDFGHVYTRRDGGYCCSFRQFFPKEDVAVDLPKETIRAIQKALR